MTAEVVPAHENVEASDEGLSVLDDRRATDAPLGEEDHARARAPGGLPGLDELREGVPHAVLGANEAHGGRLASGQDNARQALELGGSSDLDCPYHGQRRVAVSVRGFQTGLMLLERSLEGEDAYHYFFTHSRLPI